METHEALAEAQKFLDDYSADDFGTHEAFVAAAILWGARIGAERMRDVALQATAEARDEILDLVTADDAGFIEAAMPLLGKEVTVWTVRLDRPYVRGELLRFATVDHTHGHTDGLIIAGHGLIPYAEIDKLEHADSGTSLRYAAFTTNHHRHRSV